MNPNIGGQNVHLAGTKYPPGPNVHYEPRNPGDKTCVLTGTKIPTPATCLWQGKRPGQNVHYEPRIRGTKRASCRTCIMNPEIRGTKRASCTNRQNVHYEPQFRGTKRASCRVNKHRWFCTWSLPEGQFL